MQLTQKGRAYVLILLASFIFSVFAITFEFFPFLGFSISLIVFSFTAHFIKKDKSKLTNTFFAITILLSLFLAIRSEPFLIFLNLAGIFYFGSLFLTTSKSAAPENILSIAAAPFYLFLKSILSESSYYLEFKESKNVTSKREGYLNTVVIVFTTLITLAVILPLLSSANPYFRQLLLNIFDFLGLKDFHFTENLFQWIIRLSVFAGLAYLVPKMATHINKKDVNFSDLTEGINMLVPKTAVAIVLTVFFITQFQLYFASSQTLSDLGYSYSKYANEVFAQLSAVAAIVIILLYGEKESRKVNRNIALILALQGIFLTLMAYKSVYEYSAAWGFTYKRLYGFTVATWIMGIFSIYLYAFVKNMQKQVFLISSVVFSGIILILINIVNFDYLIYNCRKATTGQGTDYEYLARLSADSLSYRKQLAEITKTQNDVLNGTEKQNAESRGLFILLHRINYLQEKYSSPDIRGFNLMEYLQFKDVESIDTKVIKEKYKIEDPIRTYPVY
jgi:hypothetical protein